MKLANIGVSVGQVWRDWDKRFRRETPRLLVVEAVDHEHGYAMLRIKKTGRMTRVALSRMRPTTTGYLLVSDGEATDPHASQS